MNEFEFAKLQVTIEKFSPKTFENEEKESEPWLDLQVSGVVRRERFSFVPLLDDLQMWEAPSGRTRGAGVVLKLPKTFGFMGVQTSLRDCEDAGEVIAFEATYGSFRLEPVDNFCWLMQAKITWKADPAHVEWLYARTGEQVYCTAIQMQRALDFMNAPDKTTGRTTTVRHDA